MEVKNIYNITKRAMGAQLVRLNAIASNSALDLLNPVVLTFAILLDVADISDWDPFSPVKAV